MELPSFFLNMTEYGVFLVIFDFKYQIYVFSVKVK